MAVLNNNMDRIIRLTKYIEDLRNRKSNISPRHENRKEVFLAWVDLEIKKAEATISKLR